MTLVVKQVTADEIVPLRHAVLRPGFPREASIYAEDGVGVHIAAYDDDVLVGCATVFPDPWPGPEPPPEPAAWRLRGMAVEPGRQGTGVGAMTLRAAIDAAAGAGAPMLWANGRTSALGFYERQGWRAVGEEFLVAINSIPHYRIVIDLSGQ